MQIDLDKFRSLVFEFESSVQAAAKAQTEQSLATARYDQAMHEKWAAETAATAAEKSAAASRDSLDEFLDALEDAEPEPEPVPEN